jgi:hypothetical protein
MSQPRKGNSWLLIPEQAKKRLHLLAISKIDAHCDLLSEKVGPEMKRKDDHALWYQQSGIEFAGLENPGRLLMKVPCNGSWRFEL